MVADQPGADGHSLDGPGARFLFTERFWLFGGYRYLEYDDDAPALVDSEGSVDFYRLGLGWRFRG